MVIIVTEVNIKTANVMRTTLHIQLVALKRGDQPPPSSMSHSSVRSISSSSATVANDSPGIMTELSAGFDAEFAAPDSGLQDGRLPTS